MTLPRIARAGSARVARAALFGMIASLAALAGCIADGPGGSPMGLNLADGGETTDVASDAEAPAEADVAVAAKEARAAAEAGSISGSAALDRLIERHAAEAGVPTALAYAVVRVESRYNPKARGAGVYGLSQIKPATARSLGFSGPASALFDADTNLTYGMKYLKGAWEKGGHDVCQASMKYKGGHRATRMSASAKRYCSAVKAHMAEVSKRRRMPDTIVEPQAEPGLVGTLVAAVTPTQAKTAEPAASTTDATITKQTAAARPADKPVVAAAYAAAPKPAAIPRPEAPEEAKGAPADAATPQPAATAVVDSGKGGRVAAHPAPADPLAARMAGTDDLATELRGSGTD